MTTAEVQRTPRPIRQPTYLEYAGDTLKINDVTRSGQAHRQRKSAASLGSAW